MKQQVVRFLNEIQTPGKTLGLHRMQSLMERLGNPQNELKVIHVAGTNGKGSVCAMLTSVLIEAGYTVGLFTSPHLVEYNERIQIQRIPIDDYMFGSIGLHVKDICQKMVEDGEEMPTFFETITAIAFVYFLSNNVDIVVLETGIGGTYDATNIIKQPLVSVITSIGKDHMSLLGDSIQEITREKGGIIKENCPTVLYNSDKSVYNIINNICKGKNSMLFPSKGFLISNKKYNMESTIFTAQNSNLIYKDIYLQLLGEYQVSNAVTALMVIESLRLWGYDISKDTVYRGLKNTKWPGRMEIIQKKPTIIIDGAHNEQSAKAFIRALSNITKGAKVCMLIGVLRDKDYRVILDILVPFADTIIATQSSHERALPAEKLHNTIKAMEESSNLIVEKDIISAYETGQELLEENDFLCCVGSLYLVGELKQFLQKQEEKNVTI